MVDRCGTTAVTDVVRAARKLDRKAEEAGREGIKGHRAITGWRGGRLSSCDRSGGSFASGHGFRHVWAR